MTDEYPAQNTFPLDPTIGIELFCQMILIPHTSGNVVPALSLLCSGRRAIYARG